jgi:hypothetical protein
VRGRREAPGRSRTVTAGCVGFSASAHSVIVRRGNVSGET